mgnify:CR=1 FL=1
MKPTTDWTGENMTHYVPSKEYQHDLYNDRFFVEYILKNKKPGYFVEIGALDGRVCSQTHYLEHIENWKGIVVEPNPYWHAGLKWTRNCNIEVSPILDEEKDVKFIQHLDIPEYSQIVFDGGEMVMPEGNTKEINLKTITLTNLLEKYDAPNEIDYLAIDVEGSEIKILDEFFKNSKRKANFICIEHGHENRVANFMKDKPYIKVYNPYHAFVRLCRKTDTIIRWKLDEWVGLNNTYRSNDLHNLDPVDWEHYFVHIDYLKDNPKLVNFLNTSSLRNLKI